MKNGTQDREASYQRAAKIAGHLEVALANLMAARSAIEAAAGVAERDYEYNDASIKDVSGAARLLSNELVREGSRWHEYAQARLRNG